MVYLLELPDKGIQLHQVHQVVHVNQARQGFQEAQVYLMAPRHLVDQVGQLAPVLQDNQAFQSRPHLSVPLVLHVTHFAVLLFGKKENLAKFCIPTSL